MSLSCTIGARRSCCRMTAAKCGRMSSTPRWAKDATNMTQMLMMAARAPTLSMVDVVEMSAKGKEAEEN